jgi:type IV secretion system protein VirD4
MRVLAAFGVVAVALAGLWAATEVAAARLHDVPALGAPWARIGDWRVYAPWAWMQWSGALGRRAPEVFRQAEALTTGGALLGVLVGVVGALSRRRSPPSRAHGSARWASARELERAGLFRSHGVVLCQTSEGAFRTRVDRAGRPRVEGTAWGRLVRHDGPEHVLCFAPTRSGKGVGLVVPTLLSWRDSVIVLDIKKENWARTAGWRRQFSRVWRFEPTAADSVRFNPLLEVRRGIAEVKDAQNIADILVDPTGDREARDHWQLTAHTLLVGAILHVLYAETDKTLAGVAALLSEPSRTPSETLRRMLETAHVRSGPHPVVAQIAQEMLNKTDNELSGVVSTAMGFLALYRDPILARSTSASDFRIADLMDGDAPASLYLVVPPSDLSRTRPILRLMLNQFARRLTESMEVDGEPAYRHRLLLLLDEFPALGRLEFFETSLAFMAGYGLKAFLIAQSLNQLDKAYGPHHAIVDHCHVRLTYAANDDRTARRISDLLGEATEKKLQRSFSGQGIVLSNRTESEHEYGRALLTAAEVMQLDADDAIVLVGGLPPYLGRKVRYFADPRFEGRDRLPAPKGRREQACELPRPRPTEWEHGTVGTREAVGEESAPLADTWPDAFLALARAPSFPNGRAMDEEVGRAAPSDGEVAVGSDDEVGDEVATAQGERDSQGGLPL